MKRLYLTAVIIMTCLLGLGISARAQDTEGVRVKVPFEFVAGVTTMPAGTYTVGRFSVDGNSAIEVRGRGNGAFVLPIAFDGAAAAGQPKLRFEQVGGKYFLIEADTSGGIYNFALPGAMVALAQVKDQGTASSGGTN